MGDGVAQSRDHGEERVLLAVRVGDGGDVAQGLLAQTRGAQQPQDQGLARAGQFGKDDEVGAGPRSQAVEAGPVGEVGLGADYVEQFVR